MEDVKILGAGPAGLSAAINLAKEGYLVEVFEKNSDVGGRFHGEFQGLENWSNKKDTLLILKDMNISVKNFKYYPFRDLTISNIDKKWDFKCNKPAFYLIKRGSVQESLDNGLKNQALNNGVDIHFEKTLNVKNADIIATGPNSKQRFAVAQGIFFQTDLKDMVLCILNDKAALKGYSYLLVADGNATMSTVLFDQFKYLKRCFQETRKIYEQILDLEIKNPQKIGGVGSFSTKNMYTEKGKLYTGEAAGLQDLLWGFGIKTAIESGYIAAKSIINGSSYEKAAEKCFNYKLKASVVNRYLWEKFATNNYSLILNQIHKSSDHLKYLNHLHKFNILQKILYPFASRYMKNRYRNLKL
ncbi:MAG TPA: NAD(P)/FAD-dependent oxidoreductase [Methanobacterium sp.]|nr:NAD(P)/FAD-dependent oxidoreductase [Methanobacterium sp.]